ncbi:GNAT family N-acetyltransferase [Kaistella sp. BT6-1-3]|uniref:GNAT family N-acetyltransferase n=1 Tax=Kaistella yananensis TaxID=2989820 RepID=A0ABT3JNY2_9FLAO|nr:GNAT family N-acetyltransferase [Kaistella yananensis]MCW4452482.1 GNAT family N-acetyltransferase [Kaistella yananensis]
MQIIKFSNTLIPQSYRNEIALFLKEHLQQYGDSYEDISLALDYVSDTSGSKGGYLLVAQHDDVVTGAVVVNKTGMSGYIPENILVYIATHHDYRGKGIGKMLMEEVVNLCEGSIALHCEPDNPARKLYEKLGFTSKYLEMRLVK